MLQKGHRNAGERSITPIFRDVESIVITRRNRDDGESDYLTIALSGRMQDNRFGSFHMSIAVDPMELAEKLGELFPGITIS